VRGLTKEFTAKIGVVLDDVSESLGWLTPQILETRTIDAFTVCAAPRVGRIDPDLREVVSNGEVEGSR
jgi:hypothetical protein